MSKKKVIAVLAAVAMVATMFVGCGNKANNETKNETKQEAKKGDKIKVGLCTDEGGLNDKSFNQSAHEGIKKAMEEYNVEFKAIESTSNEEYQDNLEALVDVNKSDLIFAVGYQMADSLKAAAEKNADSKFTLIDSTVDLPNVLSVNFKEQEGSFLVGVIAGKMSKTNKIGFIGGKDGELINRFRTGFAAGVKSVNPEAAKGLIDGTTVKWAESFGDMNKGYELGKGLFNEDCDIVFHAAGGVGLGLFKSAKEIKDAGKEVWAIGVDKDQAVTDPEYKDYILTSMMKRVDSATYNATKDIADGNFKGGTELKLGLKEDGVDVAPSSKNNVPEEILNLVQDYKKAIIDGKFEVPADQAELEKFEVPQI